MRRSEKSRRWQRRRRVRREQSILKGLLFGLVVVLSGYKLSSLTVTSLNGFWTPADAFLASTPIELPPPSIFNGRPQLSPLPPPEEVWECEVVVVGGSLGGVAAASHAMQSGATTCLIELTPWLGGQISSQGVSAIDESAAMRQQLNYSESWRSFRTRIEQQLTDLPDWSPIPSPQPVANINSCWVGTLCFPPEAGAVASRELLEESAQRSPESRWAVETAFKGAEFDPAGREITAIYAVRRTPTDPNYVPSGRLAKDLTDWYSWSATEKYAKTPMRLQPPEGKRMIVIDATDTGELIGWANIPHRLGSESHFTTGEINAANRDNPECTQAFTYPFAIAIHDDGGKSREKLSQVEPVYALHEHEGLFDMEGFGMFTGRSFFHYRRIVSTTKNDPNFGSPARGDIAMINWNRGNDWIWMEPSLILTQEQIRASGQSRNWMGGLSPDALNKAEVHALLFAHWLLKGKATPEYPLAFLDGAEAPMGTVSGLSMYPYIREGRRILGRAAYGETDFMMREQDLRTDMSGGRSFYPTAVGFAHYDIDIHGCRYRNWESSGEVTSAGTGSGLVRPAKVPLEALVPQGVNNLLIGGKSMAVTHIVNAMTRIHYNEWQVGGAAGAIAGWLVEHPELQQPDEIIQQGQMPAVQSHLIQQGLRIDW